MKLNIRVLLLLVLFATSLLNFSCQNATQNNSGSKRIGVMSRSPF